MEFEKLDGIEYNEYHKNPRKITKKQFEQLQDNLRELGDLSGIVHDLNSNEFLGGNQRSKAIDIEQCEIIIIERYEKPTKTGTVAIGFVIWEGEKYNYRQVRWTPEQCEKANITANKLGGKWDFDILANEFEFEELLEYGFEEWELLGGDSQEGPGAEHGPGDEEGPGDEGEKDAEQDEYDADVSKINTDIVLGDLIEIKCEDGRIHRILCGDSTDLDKVNKLFDGNKCTMIHADPPYGMGKQKDGVQNDNLYKDNLDKFQLLWITAYVENMVENGSLYIWGNPDDLWRLWHKNGLATYDNLHFVSDIVWVKIHSYESPEPNAIGVNSPLMRCYPPATEHCLFLMRGEQELAINSEDYWEGWEPIRSYLESQAKKMKWKGKKIHELCGVQMYSHWFTKSQFVLIPEKHYTTLQEAAEGKAFTQPYEEIGGGINPIKYEYEKYKQAFFESRTYFNNTHTNQTDVWLFPRVLGNDRPDHATPKPIATAERAIKSSSRKGDIVAEPFCGSGTTLIAGHQLGRTIYTMELTPEYVAMSIDRLLKIDKTVQLFLNGQPYELKI